MLWHSAGGNYTYFLTRVMALRGSDPAAALTEADVDMALFVGVVLDELLELVNEYNHRALERVSTLDALYLETYITLFDRGCRQLREELKAKRSGWIWEQFAPLIQEAPVSHR